MLKKVFTVSILCSTFAFANFTGLTPAQLQEKINKDITIIDIRTPLEWKQTGIIPTSKEIMFFDERGGYNIQAWLEKFEKFVKNKKQQFVLVCRSGTELDKLEIFYLKS